MPNLLCSFTSTKLFLTFSPHSSSCFPARKDTAGHLPPLYPSTFFLSCWLFPSSWFLLPRSLYVILPSSVSHSPCFLSVSLPRLTLAIFPRSFSPGLLSNLPRATISHLNPRYFLECILLLISPLFIPATLLIPLFSHTCSLVWSVSDTISLTWTCWNHTWIPDFPFQLSWHLSYPSLPPLISSKHNYFKIYYLVSPYIWSLELSNQLHASFRTVEIAFTFKSYKLLVSLYYLLSHIKH